MKDMHHMGKNNMDLMRKRDEIVLNLIFNYGFQVFYSSTILNPYPLPKISFLAYMYGIKGNPQ